MDDILVTQAFKTIPGTRKHSWGGIVLTVLVTAFLIFDAVIKLIVIGPVVTAFGELGYPISLAPVIGTLALACLALYLLPRTSFLGAILLTGYLGGAVASHVRIGSPLLTHKLFPIYIALMVWGGLFLRDPRLRDLVLKGPSRSSSSHRA
ncbi:MAG TPA: DoxX family protein [Vicinamibacterales bacterium]|jgi:hypothetical protein